MPTQEEKIGFAHRLRIALNRFAVVHPHIKTIKGATDLARQFNLRHPNEVGISVQTAHKWLTGRTIPTHEKIKTLAQWLDVTEHWLHYGPPPEKKVVDINAPISSKALLLGKKIETLSPHEQYLLEELMACLSRKI